MTIEALQLAPVAKNAARILQGKHPQIEFTSGRRSIFQQAHAMANNVVVNRKWIGQTYLAGAKLQKWVDQHPGGENGRCGHGRARADNEGNAGSRALKDQQTSNWESLRCQTSNRQRHRNQS